MNTLERIQSTCSNLSALAYDSIEKQLNSVGRCMSQICRGAYAITRTLFISSGNVGGSRAKLIIK